MDEFNKAPIQAAELSREYGQQSLLSASEKAYHLWEMMGEMYSDRWVAKNGTMPSLTWKAAIGGLSEKQMSGVMDACIARCLAGNSWPPDLAEFISMVSSVSAEQNPFGISMHDVSTEFRWYCRDRGMYDSAELFPWSHPVLYWICTDVRQRMIQYRLTEMEVEKALKQQLEHWCQKVANGGEVPRPTMRLQDKTRPRPAWMDLYKPKPNTN